MYNLNTLTPSRRIGLVGLFVSLALAASLLVGAKPAAASGNGRSVCESVARTAPSTGWTKTGEWYTTQPIRKTLDIPTGWVDELIRGKITGNSYWFGVLAKGQPNNPVEPMVNLRCFAYMNGKWVSIGEASLPGMVNAGANGATVNLNSVLTAEVCNKLVASQASASWIKQGNGYTLPPVLAQHLKGDVAQLVGGLLSRFENMKNAYIGATLSAPDAAGNIPAKCFVYDATTRSYVNAGSTVINGGGGFNLRFR